MPASVSHPAYTPSAGMSPSDSGVRFAVGKPSSRPRAAPCTTMPDTVGVWPSSSVACRTSPSASSSRIQVDDTRRPPSGVTSSTTSTVNPNVAPRSMSRSTSPAPRAPYRKSRPTSTALARERVDEHPFDELGGRHRRERAVERQHQRRVDARRREQLELLANAHERVGALVGCEQRERVAVEGDDRRLQPVGSRRWRGAGR